ncbi:MAG: tRNA preQ1(34) S-adenosylmethionine ribosyltransferase-isomerase QueA [Clostridia bacterium]|nr:tRNA preQ1(34) S-adenosylmethionine ribosyltransferase-isomerase QueA [Clostridia bacterium]MBO5671340.1 tRNA preQ1(34) S-adenosylmethionine ribosyltransferase-isomerase QueA [Clostridia bacterium]
MNETPLSTKDFYYDLPERLIAQTPAKNRDESRLMVLDRKTGSYRHKIFRDILDELHPGDVLVFNESKVIPARIYGTKISENSTVRVEFLLLKQMEEDVWEVLLHPGRRLKPGAAVSFGDGVLRADILETVEDGNRIVRFSYDRSRYKNLYEVLDEIGNMPLPPYITEKLEDRSRYQTVYAKHEGSAAAPTAGLHFTTALLEALRAKGVETVFVTLHVGLGTFRPVKVDNVEDHVMHAEFFSVSREAAETINRARSEGRRIIAVGTTSVRTLESAADENGILHAVQGDTRIFIYPGYRFRCVDALITNFHLPESTLLMLISALASRQTVMNAYAEAIREEYRFFSFGDAMLIQ